MIKIIPSIDRIKRDINNFAKISSSKEKGNTRISFSVEDYHARSLIKTLMEDEAGLKVHIDPVGNIIGRKEGTEDLPSVMVGSHIDTVRGGGRFDGIAGVIAGIELARCLKENNIKLAFPIEVVTFIAEEPSPFGISTIGSRAMTGGLTYENTKSITDSSGRTLATAITEMGGEPEKLSEMVKKPGDILLNLELHIEQGSRLESEGYDLCVVTGIVGINRGSIRVKGRMDHAGTASMESRRDALMAASEIALVFETICRKIEGIVGTVGVFINYPNASNVVPGEVEMGLEIRSIDEPDILMVILQLESEIEKISNERKIEVQHTFKRSSKSVLFKSEVIEALSRACECTDVSYTKFPSGAGHDASHIAQIAPSGMIFIPSKDGRSHCPEEWSEFEHIALGTKVLIEAIMSINKKGEI